MSSTCRCSRLAPDLRELADLVDDLGRVTRTARSRAATRPRTRSGLGPAAHLGVVASTADIWAAEKTSGRPAAAGRAPRRRRPGPPARSSASVSASEANGTLYSAAKRAASAGVRLRAHVRRRSPAGRAAGPAWAAPASPRGRSARPGSVNRCPGGVDHRPVMISSCSVQPVEPLPVGGNGTPYARCSASNQPAPRAQSTRPPLMASTCATVIASGPGSRNVADVTIVPSRIRWVSRGQAGQRGPGVGRAGQPVARPWSGSGPTGRTPSKPHCLGVARDPELVVVGGAELGLDEDGQPHPINLPGCLGDRGYDGPRGRPSMNSQTSYRGGCVQTGREPSPWWYARG